MICVTSREGATYVVLCCAVCQKPLTLDTAWLSFPPGADGVEGKWLHRRCGDGQLAQLWGSPHVTLMRGEAALQAMAAKLMQA
jgi:hypothetical protein